MASIFEGLSFQSLQNASPSHDRLRSIQISTAKKGIPSIGQQIVPFWQSSAFRCQGTTKRSATCPCYRRGGITAIGAMKETAKHQFVWFLFNNSYCSKREKNKTLKITANLQDCLLGVNSIWMFTTRWTFESFPRILRSLVESDRFLFPRK